MKHWPLVALSTFVAACGGGDEAGPREADVDSSVSNPDASDGGLIGVPPPDSRDASDASLQDAADSGRLDASDGGLTCGSGSFVCEKACHSMTASPTDPCVVNETLAVFVSKTGVDAAGKGTRTA